MSSGYFDKTPIEIEHQKTIQKAMFNLQTISLNMDKIYFGIKERKLQEYIRDQEDNQIKNVNIIINVKLEVKPIVDN